MFFTPLRENSSHVPLPPKSKHLHKGTFTFQLLGFELAHTYCQLTMYTL